MKLTLARTCKGYILIVSREEEIIYVPDPLLHHDPAVECSGVLMFREWGTGAAGTALLWGGSQKL